MMVTLQGVKHDFIRYLKEEPKTAEIVIIFFLVFAVIFWCFGLDMSFGLVLCINLLIIAITLWVFLRCVEKILDILLKNQEYVRRKKQTAVEVEA